ncbi:MAG: FtsX-like permease family protein [Candidatus Cloacimonetes bacterium]|nr:FtsX-like permease family protein [Candidatus Cloacimonadota bacterium]
MFHIKLALRYLKGRKKFLFTFSNMLSVLGIVIGVFSLLVVSSVMNGFDSDMRNRVIGSKAEIKVHKADYSPIKNYEHLIERIISNQKIIGAAPICDIEMIIQRDKELSSTISYGIDLDKQKQVTEILNKIVVGEPTKEALDGDGIIIGMDLSLTLNATVGEYIQLTAPIGTEPSPLGLLPKTKKLKVIGIYISGMPEYDRIYSYISLKNSQYFLGLNDEITQIEIKSIDPSRSTKIAKKIQKQLQDEYIVEDWSEFEANLFNAIKTEKAVMFIVLALMIIIASFNMSGNFVKLVTEKRVEIGILKSMGTSQKDVMRVFIYIGAIIGILGTMIGLILALILLSAQIKYHFLVINVPGFPLQWIPIEIRILDFIFVPLVAVIISLLTTLHPAGRTMKIDTIKIIRN